MPSRIVAGSKKPSPKASASPSTASGRKSNAVVKYPVFGTLVQPKHFSKAQILAAVNRLG